MASARFLRVLPSPRPCRASESRVPKLRRKVCEKGEFVGRGTSEEILRSSERIDAGLLEQITDEIVVELLRRSELINNTFAAFILICLLGFMLYGATQQRLPFEVQLAIQEYAEALVEEEVAERACKSESMSVAILTESLDGVAKLWRSDTGECIRSFGGRHRSTVSVTFSESGDLILTGNPDGTAQLWDNESCECIRTFRGHKGRVRVARFSHDERMVLTASDDGLARLWSVASGECVQVFSGHKGIIFAAAMSADETLVLTGGQDCAAKLWNVRTGACIKTLQGHHGWVQSVEFCDGEHGLCGPYTLLTGSADRTARLWSAASGECLLRFEGHTHSVESAVFSLDGARVLTASADWTAKL